MHKIIQQLINYCPGCFEGPFQSKIYSHLSTLPKIEWIYIRLKDCDIYSAFDLRKGSYHMALCNIIKKIS